MKKKNKSLKKIFAVLVAGIFAGCLLACSAPSFDTVLDIDKIEENRSDWDEILNREDSGSSISDKESDEIILGDTDNLLKFLLIGVDSREDDFSGRSDTMLLVTINKETKKVILTSILRDIYVEIPGHGSNRLNAANVYGSSELLKETVSHNFGINVDSSVTFNFCSVRDIVDYFGGIDLELTADEIEIMNGYIVSQNDNFGYAPGTDIMSETDGIHHVNGNQTLAYCRIRYIGTDFMRTERQRTVIRKCMEKLKEGGLRGMAEFVSTNYGKVKSDLSVEDAISLLSAVTDLSDYSVSTFTIPMDGTWENATIDEMAVLSIDFKKNAEEWYKRVTE